MSVLGDEQADWHPSRFTHELWGCTLELRYPVVDPPPAKARGILPLAQRPRHGPVRPG